ncbi:MAG: hypothetical protein ABFS45_25100 [Pseudomonadota bacterium]
MGDQSKSNIDQAWYTYCPLIHAGNVDAELGWIKERVQADGWELLLLPLNARKRLMPNYIHNLDNFFRSGGRSPAIHVKADLRDTVLLDLKCLYEGGAMLVRQGEGVRQMSDLKGKKIGISMSLNAIKNEWWRVTGTQDNANAQFDC